MKRSRWNESVGRKPIDTLKLSDAEWLECLSEIKHLQATNVARYADQRSHRRQSCELAIMMLANMYCSDGRRQLYTIRTFDISATGMGFLHGAYVYKDTRVQVLLKHAENGWVKVPGKAVRCEYFKNMVHQVGVMFDNEIKLDDYLLAESGMCNDELDAA